MAAMKEKFHTVGNAIYKHPWRVVATGFAMMGLGIAEGNHTDNLANPAIQAANNSHPMEIQTQHLYETGVIFDKPDYHTQNYPADSGPVLVDLTKLNQYNTSFDPDLNADQVQSLVNGEIERQSIINQATYKAREEADHRPVVIDGKQMPVNHRDFNLETTLVGAAVAFGGVAEKLVRDIKRDNRDKKEFNEYLDRRNKSRKKLQDTTTPQYPN